MGALHPVLFFVLVYGITLFMALFVCRSVYYGINGPEPGPTAGAGDPGLTAVAYR
ncbi:hypothetical protein GCM10023184_04720 [Flaviaesturariibacter amylovorans]|uniref:Uncharacterized protein n=2 Tax=Flaviaesturariibacter amylovorans TaxID=1084520 RepID=A0ABP8G8Y7_9BACT